MKKLTAIICLMLIASASVMAQRMTDPLDRGLVAVKASSGVFLSWRIQADERYNVTYNVYRNGSRIASGLKVSNYSDTSGTTSSTYAVCAVINGQEQEKCASVKAWSKHSSADAGYLDVTLQPVYSRRGANISSQYIPNDIEMADLDGDGQLDFIVKRLNTVDAGAVYPASNDSAFVMLEAYKLDGTRLWWIDCGPNMVSLNSTEINIVAFDWDLDGRAEVLLRGADNMIIHYEGGTQLIGSATVNTRNTFNPSNGSQYAWTHTGAEYLIYMDGLTGRPYQVIDFPLKRLESGESNLKSAWGDDYGHRSSKYFFGAPYLDGLKPSIFLGRGIYTRHKMVALDVNPQTHQLTERWRWSCNNSSSPWYGNGYHNYAIADVDEDGRDEIIYGSMVIDDNGKGLSTSGFEHGDAMHVSDFDPYRKGLEFFGCLEDGPYHGFNYRNATTSEIYHKFTASGDDGRALAGNFYNTYPGAQGQSSSSGYAISCVTDKPLPRTIAGGTELNFRIYWDGDLCSELFNSPGTEREGCVDKAGSGHIFLTEGCNTNNSTKNNPCFQGDIIGDWREEIVMRCGRNIRIFTTAIPTQHAIPSLWYDHQYRQAMVWQMMAYNQPPHLSYYLGELEDITQAPPPYTLKGRTIVENGSTIGTAMNGQQLLACETADMSITISDGASPASFFDNAPSWVQGTDTNGSTGTKVRTDGSVGATNLPPIRQTSYTHTVNGGAFTGAMNLVKQGDGTLVLPNVVETYTGKTDIWAGTLQFDGTMQSSPVWMNRFTTLNTTGGQFLGGLTMNYASSLNVGGAEANNSSVTVSQLTLNYGARVVLDYNNANNRDDLNLTTLKVGTKDWEYGPYYLAPVFEIHSTQSELPDGSYVLGTVGTVSGDLSQVVIESNAIDVSRRAFLKKDGSQLLLVIDGLSQVPASTLEFAGLGLVEEGEFAGKYLPLVTTTVNTFEPTAGTVIKPTLTYTFTDTHGNVTELGTDKALFAEDYEQATDASAWVNGGGTLELLSGHATYGKYIHHNIGSAMNRSMYTLFNAGTDDIDSYTLEFDACITAGNVANRSNTDLVVMSKGAVIPTNVNVGYNYDATKCNATGAGYLLRLQAYNSQTFTINDGNQTLTLDKSKWYHFALTVDVTNRSVGYAIATGGSNVASGTFTPPAGTSLLPQGIFILDGRGSGDSKFDNISITQQGVTLSPFQFTELGTLTVTASSDGYKSASASYENRFVYTKSYESPAYNEIAAANARATLGTMWSSSTTVTRWANWNKTNAIYGDSYVMVQNTGTTFDKDGILSANSQNGAPLFLVEGFGIGRNYTKGNTTITAKRLGNADTYVYYKADLSRGGNPWFDEGWAHPNSSGTFTYSLQTNATFCQLIAFTAEKPVATAIAEVTNEPNRSDDNVYNMAGQLVRIHATTLDGLPRGVYIFKGKRIFVR